MLPRSCFQNNRYRLIWHESRYPPSPPGLLLLTYAQAVGNEFTKAAQAKTWASPYQQYPHGCTVLLQKGWKSWGVQATESPITSWLLLASAVLFVFQAATAGRQISLPAALCKLACAKMSAKIAFAIFAAIEKWCWPTCCQTTHLSTSICFVFAAAYLVLRPKAQ